MTHGYVFLYDRPGRVLLQRKACLQHFSVQRNCFSVQPVCGNPGQYTLPGGSLNHSVLYEKGALAASLKQFNEESGISLALLEQLKYSLKGCYTARENSRSVINKDLYHVHFIEVDDIEVIAAESNTLLIKIKEILKDPSLSQAERETCLRDTYSRTGFNDDASESYDIVSIFDVLQCLKSTIPLSETSKRNWKRLVRDQRLFLDEKREERIRHVITDPGAGRDWFLVAIESFFQTAEAQVIFNNAQFLLDHNISCSS